MDETQEALTQLCKACGLCCTGRLFIWAKLRPAELDPAEALGMTVFRSDPTQRGFGHPCPLWQGQCTIYETPHYPKVCRAYTCNVFDEVQAQKIPLTRALTIIEEAKILFREVEALLPASSNPNFRERFVHYLETEEDPAHSNEADQGLHSKAEALMFVYEKVFGVKDLLEKPAEDEFL
ncbi:MAG: YkgJ family cysteine cluster protein [Anaerolineales bacterium]|jgi:hypothetical protein|nr:YkgJ family cysteine cluster protein [Anaerolineales bacterium]